MFQKLWISKLNIYNWSSVRVKDRLLPLRGKWPRWVLLPLEELVHAPYSDPQGTGGDFGEEMETCVHLKIMAQKYMINELCNEIDEGGLLLPDRISKENYELALSYSNRILNIPNVDMGADDYAPGLIRKALALALLQYKTLGEQASTGAADDDWEEIQRCMGKALELCDGAEPEMSLPVKRRTLESSALIWKLRAEHYEKIDSDVVKECQEMAAKIEEELSATDTADPSKGKKTIPNFLMDKNFSYEEWCSYMDGQKENRD